ncbi:MAG: DUF1015 domain-containing protein [Pirellulaceae bacterium]|nr:DUF1015 domain-containing protein [Pirellulaceae bacterium]
MPDISAFRGLRYDLGHIGSLENVVAPPYDVIDTEMQTALYDKHPANVIRLILNRQEPGDETGKERYQRAVRFLKNWQKDGVLQSDPLPAIYVYHQIFTEGTTEYTRRGFLSRVKLEPFGTGNIYPHEETHSAAKKDRMELISTCKANLSPIFGIFPDEKNEAQNLLEAAITTVTPLETKDHLGVIHRLWPVTDTSVITKLTAIMGPKPMFVADGHHRYETACEYRDKLKAETDNWDEERPENSLLCMSIGMSDPGMIVLPTHRLFRGLAELTSVELIDKLGENFTCTPCGTGSEQATKLWEEIEVEGNQGQLALYTHKDNTWTMVKITAAGQEKMARIASDKSTYWQELGVSILHRLIVDDLLEGQSSPAPKYVRSLSGVIEGIQNGDTAGRDATGQAGTEGHFPLVALVMPAQLDHIQAISENNERMPAKSTYFYPKLLSGLVFNIHE